MSDHPLQVSQKSLQPSPPLFQKDWFKKQRILLYPVLISNKNLENKKETLMNENWSVKRICYYFSCKLNPLRPFPLSTGENFLATEKDFFWINLTTMWKTMGQRVTSPMWIQDSTIIRKLKLFCLNYAVNNVGLFMEGKLVLDFKLK